MADTKISALTAATTPLAGTEVLPIVQGGVTKKVAVADLTTGRSVSTADLYSVKTSAGAVVDVVTIQNLSSNAGTEAALFFAPTTATGNIRGARISAINDGSNVISLRFYTGVGATISAKYELTSDGNLKSLVAGKGLTVTSPDGLTTKTITINNAGLITLI